MTTTENYQTLYQKSLENIHAFWIEQAQSLTWGQFPTQSLEYVWDGAANTVEHKWFADGTLNVAVNCLDRYLQNDRATKLALLWQGQDPEAVRKITYQQLHRMVCRCANVLLRKGIKKGDRVVIYLPVIPETIACLLACARIGAISVLLLASAPIEILKNILQDSRASLLITQDEYYQTKEWIPIKLNIDAVLQDCVGIKNVMIIKQGAGKCTLYRPRDSWWHHEMEETSHQHQAVPFQALDPLFISYQNNVSENAKGLVYSMGGFLVNASVMHPFMFAADENNTFGNSEVLANELALAALIYGTLSHGFTLMLHENFSFTTEPNPDFFVKFVVDETVMNVPCLGMDPIILNETGTECANGEAGELYLKRPWPGIAQTIWDNHAAFIEQYFSKHPLYYSTGSKSDGDFISIAIGTT